MDNLSLRFGLSGARVLVWALLFIGIPMVNRATPVRSYNVESMILNQYRYLFSGPLSLAPVQMSLNPDTVSRVASVTPPILPEASLRTFERYMSHPGSYIAKAVRPPETAVSLPSEVNYGDFDDIFNRSKPDEKTLLRAAWAQAFGFDVWYPYYKAQEVESWVKERFRVRVFKLKGEPEFTRNSIAFNFNAKF
ncbi:MAG: hypothetical protein ACM3OC_01060 [Deltaproteobacteria bacterium]